MSAFAVRPGIVLNDVTDDSVFGFEFFTYRSPVMVREMDMFIEAAKGKTSFLDIGANAGLHSCVFQTMNHGVTHAFEPAPLWFPTLLHNTKDLAVTCHQIGLSDSEGNLKGHIEDKMFVAGEEELQGINPAGIERGAVPITTGDKFCADHNLRPDMIKIDVEGHEAAVLRGLRQTLSTCAPVVLVEVHAEFLFRVGLQADFDATVASLPIRHTILISANHWILIF